MVLTVAKAWKPTSLKCEQLVASRILGHEEWKGVEREIDKEDKRWEEEKEEESDGDEGKRWTMRERERDERGRGGGYTRGALSSHLRLRQ